MSRKVNPLAKKFTMVEQIALLAVADIQVLDSDRGTEADVSANAGLLARYRATSVRHSCILEAELTTAEYQYLRQWDEALKRKGGIPVEDTHAIDDVVNIKQGDSFQVTLQVPAKTARSQCV